MTDLSNITIDWNSYGAAIREGIECERDGSLPMNPAIRAFLEGNEIRFEFESDLACNSAVYEIGNFSHCDYNPDIPLDGITDADLDEIEAWYSDPSNCDGYQLKNELLEALAERCE